MGKYSLVFRFYFAGSLYSRIDQKPHNLLRFMTVNVYPIKLVSILCQFRLILTLFFTSFVFQPADYASSSQYYNTDNDRDNLRGAMKDWLVQDDDDDDGQVKIFNFNYFLHTSFICHTSLTSINVP